MPTAHDDDAIDDSQDDLGPDDADTFDDADDSIPDMICPRCRGQVLEDAQKCPHCGDWITPVDPARGGWRRIGWILIVLMTLLTILSLMF